MQPSQLRADMIQSILLCISQNVVNALVNDFDMLESYSVVYCGDQSCSYRGTTIQPVQPSPAIVYPSVPTVCAGNNQTMAQVRIKCCVRLNQLQAYTMPQWSTTAGNSPHKLGKVGPKWI